MCVFVVKSKKGNFWNFHLTPDQKFQHNFAEVASYMEPAIGEDLPRTAIVGSLAEQADHFLIGQTLLPLCFLTSFPFFPQAAGQGPINILEPGNSRENQLNSFSQPLDIILFILIGLET